MTQPIARAVRTSAACPTQWDAWTADGQYLYLRYRSGIGTADAYDDPDPETWTRIPDGNVARFDTEDRHDAEIDLEDFCYLAGLELALRDSAKRPTAITRIRRWLAGLLRRIGKRDAIEYEHADGIITIDQPLSEADVERFRKEFQKDHPAREH